MHKDRVRLGIVVQKHKGDIMVISNEGSSTVIADKRDLVAKLDFLRNKLQVVYQAKHLQ